jgi:hypothetical protein
LPDSLIDIIPENKLAVFNELVECVVEVGIVDMYGATTDEPLNFLKKCMAILRSHGIAPPKLENIFDIQRAENKRNIDWGEPISYEDSKNIQ